MLFKIAKKALCSVPVIGQIYEMVDDVVLGSIAEEEQDQVNDLVKIMYEKLEPLMRELEAKDLPDEELEEWMDNTQLIVDKCSFEFKERNRLLLPTFSEDDDSLLITESKKGLIDKMGVSEWSEVPVEYRKRLGKEVEIILRKGFASYIMILWDVFNFARDEEIMRGPARGSGGGSLLLFALDISTLDPIKYGLIFERFLSDERSVDVVYDYFGEAI